jgi:hypothetical protein
MSRYRTWLKLTDTHRNDVFPMAMLSEKITENNHKLTRWLGSITFGFTAL